MPAPHGEPYATLSASRRGLVYQTDAPIFCRGGYRDLLDGDRARRHRPHRPGRVMDRAEFDRRWAALSHRGQAYARLWEASRAETEADLARFGAERMLVEEARDEFVAAFPEYQDNPPPRGEATP